MPERAPSRGRPRDIDAGRRILIAARDLLLVDGYAALSIDEVADQAGVAKTTLYRRWPTKDHLIVAVVALMQDDVPILDTGDIRADLTDYLRQVADGLNTMRRAGLPESADDRSAGVVAEIAAAAARHADLGTLIRAVFARRNAMAIGLLASAARRGALRTDLDVAVLFDQLVGPLYYRILVTGEPVDHPYLDLIIDGALRGARPSHAHPA
ncbi:TetR/AcrR family transcriptional regulator [Micromonospora sp. DR5-3]|uniref:TetR/AcrR family transcriptional regulator n=1 Tax=unclassified Micromonospora TaxID=2617518 RepID=UPI002106BCFA|nr:MULTISPECIES: TetR/AcrR family transcriptional regulator [unclassified Micromonospora]MCW3819307.1 TetR/AcrR family transcriptional regulator [Micromonospora sp. DR5-3]